MAASDGNTSTFFDYAYPHFGFTGIDLGAGNAHRITKVRFYPRAGCQARMIGGMFQGSNAAPAVESVITMVRSSDGREVNYLYDTIPDPVLSLNWLTLNTVQYDDGTNAAYSYVLKWPGQRPLLAEANDPRYDAPAVHMKYDITRIAGLRCGPERDQRGDEPDRGDLPGHDGRLVEPHEPSRLSKRQDRYLQLLGCRSH